MTESTRGQQNRKQISQEVMKSLEKYCPKRLEELADFIAFDFNLSPYTVRYTYLPMYITVGILQYDGDNQLVLTPKGKKLQTTEDGLTPEQLTAELEEENEQRAKLGKPKIDFEEWKKKRSRRIHPLK